MNNIYLAINHGPYEGWSLTPFDTTIGALNAVKDGQNYGQEWKILYDLEIKVEDPKGEK